MFRFLEKIENIITEEKKPKGCWNCTHTGLIKCNGFFVENVKKQNFSNQHSDVFQPIFI